MKNTYKVPKKKWSKWNHLARKVFNEVYSTIKDNSFTLFPPKAQWLPKQTLRVIAWNMAWIAADAAHQPAIVIVKDYYMVKTKNGFEQRPVKKR